jgi:hypothetical protein
MLLITAALKVLTVSFVAKWSSIEDPVLFFVSNRFLASAAATVEILVAIFLLSSASPKTKNVIILWLSWCFAFYHVALHALGAENVCLCTGDPMAWPTLFRREHLETILICLVSYMLVTSSYYSYIDFKAAQNNPIPTTAAGNQ